jgi:type VI protein secretion system component Hcp
MEKNTAPKKDANPDPKISKDELTEGDLNKVTGGVTGDGKVHFSDFTITMHFDKASPILRTK